jgi:leader peptidase (prepilin peptidase)/N-methyltransferase
MIELISGGFAITLLLKYGLTVEWISSYTFTVALLVVTFIDIDHGIIPDIITLPGILFFLLVPFISPHITWVDSIIGALLGGGSLLLVAMSYQLITKKEGMGGGDIKLLAMVGAFVGWQGVFFTIFLASVVGTLVGLILMLQSDKGLKLAIPFGPFLSIGAIAYIHFGNNIIHWYFR